MRQATATRRRLARTLGAASCVREPLRFAIAELSGRRSQRVYRLRGSGLRVPVRHPLVDMWVLEELFRFRAYELPPPVLARLSALGRTPRVLDLGGHAGYFGLYLFGLLGDLRVVSFEPDPRNVRALRRCVEVNGLGGSWEVVEAAATTADGRAEFESGFQLSRVARPGESLQSTHAGLTVVFPFLAGSGMLEVERVEVATRDVLPLLAEVDLVKIDIEGGEWEILADPRFGDAAAAALALEYHPRDGDLAAARGAARKRLAEAGYQVAADRPGHDAGLLWGWREAGP